jgi:hypothetical protein
MSRSSVEIQGVKNTTQLEPKITVSKTRKIEIKNEIKIAVVDKKQQPEIPIKRPKKTQDKKLKNGKMITEKYIKNLKLEQLDLNQQ